MGDELGIIIKAVPDNGTTTGVGGYTTFYLPNGVQVLDAAFLLPGSDLSDGITGYDKVSAKGQAQMPSVGAGGGPTVNLVGVTRGPNILGVISPIVAPGNINLGTLPGVYGDTGIFYSTAPETAYGTYTGGTLTNNSGDTVGARTLLGTPLNKWDAWQMQAYGIAGASNPAYSSSPVIDSNGRGYAPWGLANAVAGPQSGYAWEFDKDKYDACDPLPYAPSKSCINQATQDTGPWQRIKYPGSQFADDPPGANPAVQPYTRGADASSTGFDLTTGDLPPTTGQANGTPNAIRFAFGQLTINTPEFAWVKVKINNTSAILDNTGCPYWRVDTFGGDAGGDSSGKDHIWRYYDPNSVNFNGCLAVGKPATKDVVKVGDTFQYKVKVYNMGNGALSNVVVRDTLPSGVTWISSVPTQNSGPNPLVWNVGAILPGEKFEALVTVKATGSGVLNNTLTATGNPPSGPPITTTAYENTVSGNIPLLNQRKSVTPASVAPGGNVQYTVRIENVGSGPTGSPIAITEYLPAGFTYLSKDSVTVNGANMTAATTVNATNPNQPIFTAPAAVNAGQVLLLIFTAKVGATVTPGSYCNSYKSNQADINLLTGALACVNVGGAAIGDTVYRDWNGNGAQDVGEEALPGIQVCATPTAGGAPICATTDANGNYLINGLTAGSYTVAVTNPPAGYTPRQTVTNPLTLNQGDKIMTADFGYQPGGAGSIGDTVWDDINGDGVLNGVETGIPNVTVNLYEDTNGNGAIDSGDLLIATTSTNASGNYSFPNLATGLSYIVDVDESDPDLVSYHSPNSFVATTPNLRPVPNLTGSVTTADFGYKANLPSSIGDTVCLDSNENGLCEPGEPGIANITVKLYRDLDNDGVADPGELAATTATDVTGGYLFGTLGPDDYIVVVDKADPDLPGGYTPEIELVALSLSAGENRSDVDFPFTPLLSKTVNLANANPGDTLLFTITPNYSGSALLTNAKITDTVPTGTTFANAGQGGMQSGGVVTWNLGSNTARTPGFTTGTAVCTTYLDRFSTVASYTGSDGSANWSTSPWVETDTNGGGATSGNLQVNTNASCQSGNCLLFKNSKVNDNIYREANLSAASSATFSYDYDVTGFDGQVDVQVSGNGGGSWTMLRSYTKNFTPATGSETFDVSAFTAANTRVRLYVTAAKSKTIYIDNVQLGSCASGSGNATAVFSSASTTNSTNAVGAPNGTLAVVNANGGSLVLDLGSTLAAGVTVTIRTKESHSSGAGGQVADVDAGTNGTTFTGLAIFTPPNGGALADYSYTIPASGARYIRIVARATTGNASAQNIDVDALSFTGGAAMPSTGNTLNAQPTLVVNGDTIQVSMVLTANTLVNNVAPGALSVVNQTGGASATCGGPSPASASVGPGGTTFTYSCTAMAGATPGGIALRANATNGTVTWANATSNSVLVTPPLTFQVTINNPVGVSIVQNKAYLSDSSGAIPAAPSNTTQTALGASIGDRVWADLDGDGVQDAGEPGIAGVVVWIDSDNDGVRDPGEPAATTDTNGTYLLAGLSAGTYSVRADLSTAPAGYIPTTLTNLSVPLSAGQQYTAADFGLRPPGTASIGDAVWLDSNEDGIVDANESGLPNVTVRLYIDQNNDGVIDGSDTLIQTAATAANGLYQFSGLHPDDYLVEVVTSSVVTTPFGVATTIGAALEPTIGATNPRDVSITTAGQAITNADFGYHWGGSIGDYAWYDNNGNQLQDGGEPPAPNATTVLFYDTNGDGNYQSGEPILAVDVTDVSGAYLFDNLPPGNYVVQISEQEVPALPSSPHAGQIGRMVATTGTSYGLTVAPNQDYLTADFGFMEAAEVEGHVFHDVNHSSVFDPSEPGLSHVTVTLTGIDANGAPVSLTTITDADGEYAFIVPSGSYTITYQTANIPVGLTEATTPTSLSFSVGAGQELSGFDFGVDNAGRIGDTVFIDANSNGVQDASEPGLAGVTVQLYDSTGATLLASTVTTATGGYLFSGLPDGLYQVNPDGTTAPAGYTLTTGNDPDTATVSGGGSDLASDFGYRPPGTLRTISGRVYDDANNNNNDDGEPGFANIDIAILCDTGFFTVRTNATGAWSISGVQNGSICTILDADETDLPRQAYALTEAPTSVTVNADLSGLDFGYHLRPGSISGTVVAGDGDGLAEVGETPIQSVTVILRYAGVDGILHTVDDVVSTQQTNLGGGYSFTDLNPGLYEIIEINPPNYNSLADVDGNHPDSINLMLALDEDRLAQDFEDQAIFTGNPSYALAKWLNGASPVRTGEAISFTLRITNTGDVTITVLPISDTYDIRYLAFTGATPGPADNSDDGRLDWSDVTSSLGDLAPGAFFDVIVQFTVWHDTTLLPNSTTINRVAAHDVLADPDGAGAIPPQSAPDASPASAGVTIEAPTAVEMAEYTATYLSGQVLLYWRTANEVDAVAFHVLRQTDSGAWVQLTTDPIVAQKAGQVAGAEYTYVDSTVEVRHHYRYILEVLSTSGKNSYNTIGDVVAILQFFLPLVSGQ